MKTVFVLLFYFFSVLVFAGPIIKINSPAEFETYLNDAHFNGVILVKKDDQVLFKEAFGVKNFVSNSPLTTEDKFQIGSVSKQFTSAALLKLQEEGKLSLDDDITKYLNDYPVFKGIKIRDLLNHTAGVANYTDQADFWRDLNKSLTLSEITEYISKLPFDFAPTTKWQYSNSGYILAGRIVEIVTGQSWDNYIKEKFLIPMQMINSGYVERFESVSDVTGYIDGSPQDPSEFGMSWALSAGGLYSTVDDLAKWADIYDSSPLLSDDSKTQMQTPFLNNYALGLEVLKTNDEVKISHSGRTPGFTTQLIYLKKAKLKVVKFDNTDGGVVDPSGTALSLFYNGSANAIKVKPYPADPSKFYDYVGNYVGQTMNFNVFVQDGELYLQPNDGQPPYKLTANDLDSFSLLGIAGEEFTRNDAGKVIGMKHYQGAIVSEFKKDQDPTLQPKVQKIKTLNQILM